MKIFFYLIISLIILEGCGKKSDPQYQVKYTQLIVVLS